jgi:tripartite-type tricarboxylate transporter receptor subunit TctC
MERFSAQALVRAFAAVMACLVPVVATAQTYPVKPIRLVFPWPAGGADIVPRVLAELLPEDLGQQVLVDNRPGAGGTVGTAIVAKAAPDGYTLLMNDMSSHAISASLYKSLPYDVVADFAPVTLAARTPMVLVATPTLEVKSLKDFVALARAKPGQLNYASSGNGAITHLAAERLKRLAGIDLIHVPYKGSAPAVAAVLAGEVSVAFSTVPPVLGHARAGKLVPLAVTFTGGIPQLPGVPSLASEVAGFDMGLYQGVLAPAGTPKEIVERLNGAIAKAMRHPKMVEIMRANVLEPLALGPDAFRDFLGKEVKAWGDLVRTVGLKVD